MSLDLTVATTLTDRTAPILDGRIPIEGCNVTPVRIADAQEIFRRALNEAAFDIAEMSMSTHIVMSARGHYDYVALPVFLSRAFRHSSIYIRSDRGITSPEQLAGRRIGLEQYQQTIALWVRGIMSDVHGVKASSIDWVNGGLEKAGGGERVALSLPPGIRLQSAPEGESLNSMLARGDIDAIIATRPPSCFINSEAPVARLFPDYRAAEIEYFRKTGNFPIMHCLLLRRSLSQQHPWLAQAVFDAFAKSKAQALNDLTHKNFLRVSLPWAAEEAADMQRLMGERMWAYGLEQNRHELEDMLRYALADGLIAKPLQPDELFARVSDKTILS
jgi:4,5-dihydroxyphthalate decarboxylase